MNENEYYHFFSNLANPLKIRIIVSLKEKEKNVTQIAESLKEEQSKISHALTALKVCKIVESKQNGKERVYFLNKETILPMLKLIEGHREAHCDCKNCSRMCGK